jgi:hypothetical protein
VKGNRYLPLLAVAGFVLFGLGMPQASAQSYLFNEAGFTTGINTSPEVLVSADFNGDGQPDIATADHNAATVTILVGNSNGTFSTVPNAVSGTVGNDPVALVAADFNNDGKIDLAVVSSSGNAVALLIGNGNGTFTVSGTLATGNNPGSIVAGDFNGDQNIDLAVSNFNDSTISVFLGNGDGTFGAGTTFATGASPDSIAVGDFNKDGKLDVVTADGAANSVSILLGNGDGTFQTHVEYSCGQEPLQVIVDDFNQDGNPDLAVADGGQNDVVIMLGTGNGRYASSKLFALPKVPRKLVSGDLNDDGIPDLAYTSTAGGFAGILLGTGSGTFNNGAMYATGNSGQLPDDIITTDVNGDGRLDLAMVNPADNDVAILLGNGDGTFASTTTVSNVASGPVAVATADFNGDGKLDAVAVSATDNSVCVLLGNGDGTFQSPVNCNNPVGANPQDVAVGDFNGDQHPDLAVVNETDGTVSVLLNNGDGTFANAVTYPVGQSPLGVAVGDFNGDGLPDLAVANYGDATVSVLLNSGNGAFATAVPYAAGSGPSSVAAANLFGHSKGTLDLAVADQTGNTVSVLEGNGDGTFQTNVTYSTGSNTGPVAVSIGDFNKDGFPDLATANTTSSTVSILLNSGTSNPGTFGTAVSYPTGLSPFSIATGDLNGDGSLDLAVGNTSANVNAVSTLFGNGDGTFQTHLEHATGFILGGSAEGVALGDFTGTGSLDVAAADQLLNVVDVFLNTPVTAISPAQLTFPGTLVGSTSSALTVTISNPGSTPLPFTSAAITLGTFTATNNCPSTIAVGGSCTASVIFAPTTGGTATGTLTITDGDVTSPQAVALTGTGTAPTVSLSPTTVTFAGQNIGTTSAAQTVTLSNTGTGPLNITSIVASTEYAETNTCGSTLAAAAMCTVSVTFTPTKAGTQTGTLTFTDNATNSPQTVALTGSGSGALVGLTPSSVTFASQPVGTTSAPQIVTLTNTGNTNLTVSSVTVSGPYAVTNTCGGTLGGGASCSITITFTPTATGTQTGTVTIADNASGSPQTVPLSGTGSTAPLVALSPTTISFPTTPVGIPSTAVAVTLTNNGNAVLNLTGFSFSGANPGDFSETNACTSSLAAGGKCTIMVTFTPMAVGNRSATLNVADNATGSPQTLPVSGTGSSEAIASLSPTSLNFGSPNLDMSTSKAVTLTNTGNATLTVSSVSIDGSNSYTETNNCTSVSAGKTCSITVTFDPTTLGTLSATLDVADNAGGSPQIVTLSGTGVGPSVGLAPTSLTFGGQLVMTKSAAKTVTLTNSGTTSLSSIVISITGTGASQFSESSTCGTSVGPGASCPISVIFAPALAGNQVATLSIADSAQGSPQSVALSGAGSGFSLGATNSTAMVSPGVSAIYNLNITGLGGFNQTVSLTCTDSITSSSCTVFPSSLTVTAPNTATANVSVLTTAGTLPPKAPRAPAPPRPWMWLGTAATLALGIKLLTRRLRRSRPRSGWALAGALALVLVWAACGGGSNNTITGPTPTPTGTYSVTVTGTSTGVTASTTLSVVVQ